MATEDQVEKFQKILDNMASNARADFRDIWTSVEDSDVSSQREALMDAFPEVIAKHGEMSASAASDVLEEWLGDDIDVKTASAVDADKATERMRWALGTDNPQGNLEGIVDELAKQPGRDTVFDTADGNDDVGWMRMAEADACALCQMAASRGVTYKSEETAGGGEDRRSRTGREHGSDKFHPDCRCELVAVRSDSDIPEGYDIDKFDDRYKKARKDAKSGDPKKILSQMRENQPGIH